MTESIHSKFTSSTCPYCGVGCGVIIESRGDEIVGVQGDPDHPANFGRLCTKGSTLALTASSVVARQTRVRAPMIRRSRQQAFEQASWDDTLASCAHSFSDIIGKYGPDAVGFYISGQFLTEDYYVFNKLAKGLIGTNNIDSNSRLCMSSAVAGYKQSLGSDAPPNCYDDVNHADCLFIAGSNTAYAHPVLFRRIEEAKKAKPQLKVVVVDPRRTETAEMADLFLPIQPGTDVALFNGMLHLMLWESWINPQYIAAHTQGFDALKATVRDYGPDRVSELCGISKADLLSATRLFATSAATMSLYCQGLNQSSSGTAKNTALINLHLATGHIGRPGAGPFSLTGQPNAMGGREVGGMANLLSGHRDLAKSQDRAEVAALWGVASVPDKPGKTAVEMFQAAADGEIKALWIACTNPAQSMPDQATVRRALERAELVIVQEAFADTATVQFAHVLLPASTWGEKVGTVTNSERRISRVRAAVAAQGEARHDWSIAMAFGKKLEGLLRPEAPSLFAYLRDNDEASAQAIWEEHRESTRGRDLDITGLSYEILERRGPQQWPYPASRAELGIQPAQRMSQAQPLTTDAASSRLYTDGIFPTPEGRARFINNAYVPVAQARDARYPFSLTTGRLRDQWHGMSRTGLLGRLFAHVTEPSVQMNPQDMSRRLIKNGDLVHVTSRLGSIVVPVQGSSDVGLSQAFVSMHWGEEFLSGRSSTGLPLSGVNALTTSVFCPSSKQPELKHVPVKILKAELPWSLLIVAWIDADRALEVRQALREKMSLFPFASCVPFSNQLPLTQAANERAGILFRAAGHEPPDDVVLAALEKLVGLEGVQVLRYADRKRHQRRAMRLSQVAGERKLESVLLSGDTRSEAWILSLLQSEGSASAYGRLLLAPGAQPPIALESRAAQVCSCFNVSETAIQDFLTEYAGPNAETLASLQASLKCGTNCGSCLPQLKKIIRQAPLPAV